MSGWTVIVREDKRLSRKEIKQIMLDYDFRTAGDLFRHLVERIQDGDIRLNHTPELAHVHEGVEHERTA